MSHKVLQRHSKCSAFYASHLCRESEGMRPIKALNTSVAYFVNVTVEVTTKTFTRDESTFAITVHNTKPNSTWRHVRSYTECQAFQRGVLTMLSRGHLCFAECPWLYAYVARALPAEHRSRHFFRGGKSRIVENQRQALARFFATLQRVLLNPLNQECIVLMQQVAVEVIKFITNRTNVNIQKPLHSPSCDQQLAQSFSEAFMFKTNEDCKKTEEAFKQSNFVAQDVSMPAENDVVAGQRVCCAMCAVHKSCSDEQVFANWQAKTSSHFIRMQAQGEAGVNWTSIVAKCHLQTQWQDQKKNVSKSPAYSQRATSPLEILVTQEDRDCDTQVAMEHDGTPKSPFPWSASTPRTPREWIASPLRTSSVCEVNLEMLDDWRLSGAIPSPLKDNDAAPAVDKARCSGVKTTIRRMPFHPLLLLSSIRNKFGTTKHCTGII